MADPQLEPHWLPDPRFVIQGVRLQGLRRIVEEAALVDVWEP